jgi:hypothetical protein
MRERCWFIPEQVLKGKLPYRDFETFYGPPNPFLLAVVYYYYIGGIGTTPERATGFVCRLSSRRHVLSCPTLELHRRFRGCTLLPPSFWRVWVSRLMRGWGAGLRPVLNLSLGAG